VIETTPLDKRWCKHLDSKVDVRNQYLWTIVQAVRFPKIRTKVAYQRSKSATIVLFGRLSTTQCYGATLTSSMARRSAPGIRDG